MNRLGRVAFTWTITVAALLVPILASAKEGVRIALSFEACPSLLGLEVERIARIELHASQRASVGHLENVGAVTQLGVACEGDKVRLAVDDPITGKRVERSVSLAGVESGVRARLLALAIAELVRSSWLELDMQPTPALPLAAPTHVSPELREQARRIAVALKPGWRAWRPSAAIEALVVPSVGTPVLGVSLAVQHELSDDAFAEATVSAWDGATERATGAIAVRQLALDPGLGLRVGRFEAALGARVGWVTLTGTPSGPLFRGDTTSGAVFGPLLAASAGVVGPLRLWLRLGWLVQGERGIVAGDSDVTMGGLFGSVGLGLRIDP